MVKAEGFLKFGFVWNNDPCPLTCMCDRVDQLPLFFCSKGMVIPTLIRVYIPITMIPY